MTDTPDRGRDLLFAVIALQMNFVTQEQFVEVMLLLPGRPGRSADALFRDRGYLSEAKARALEQLLQVQLDEHGGDVERSIAAFEGNVAVGRSLLMVGARPVGREPVLDAPTVSLVRAPRDAERYAIGRELGRGGLGRVVLALDRDLMGREVAMKLLVAPDLPRAASDIPIARERFLEEAHVTAQLQHPNIVAVYELGTHADGQIYYTMPVVTGRTLREEIRTAHGRLARGEVSSEAWGVERLRLLGAFQGLCHGLSYAHARGVIHRDVKPANVMVGEHGETIVLDWGLAKTLRRSASGGSEAVDDSRSDVELEKQISSLRAQRGFATVEGTVTGTPAYMSPEQASGRIREIDERSDIYSLGTVLYEILTGAPPFKGGSAYEILLKVIAGNVPDPRTGTVPVPEDLAAVCLRALKREKQERYPSVEGLLSDLALAIEGGKERERKHGWCLERLAAARDLVRQSYELDERIAAHRAALQRQHDAIPAWEPIDAPEGGKIRVLALEQELEADRARAGTTFNAALAALAEALGFEPDNAEAREELASLHYFHMVKAEQGRELARLEFHKSQVAVYDDGVYARRLRGDGGVAIISDPPGAEALLSRYEEHRWFLTPVGECSLGRTPVAKLALPMGSYLLVLRKEGYRDTRVPFVVGRLEDVVLDVRLFTDAAIGADLVHVPRGRFLSGPTGAMRDVHVDDFFIGRFPVTFGEYCEYLDWLDATDPGQVVRRAPRDQMNGLYVRKGPGGRFEPHDPMPLPGDQKWWDPREPVFSVSYQDAVAYLAWRSGRDGRVYVIPTAAERQKAARGADGRLYPWGNRFDPTLCKNVSSREGPAHCEPVGAFPSDESPYGVRDVVGGVCDWTSDVSSWGGRGSMVTMGGAWRRPKTGTSDFSANLPQGTFTDLGFRVCVRPCRETG
ncbi:MAG: bifunctional serine/threonine-protein kinase/formylglycine-generating enzyme family protein [Acidobacteriota bacterium]